jgi:NADH/NAD ratio-sensing transcriptional regulator Rex
MGCTVEINIGLNTNDLRTGDQIMRKMLSALDERELEIIGSSKLSKTLEVDSSEIE